jgi:membrane-bound ClpP family serine protease
MISKILDHISEYLAHRKGLLPLIGIMMIIINLILQFGNPPSWLATSNLCLHFGLIIAILGLMLARAL